MPKDEFSPNGPCYVCGGTAFANAVHESPIEERFGIPVLPADAYVQKRCRSCGLFFVDCNVTEDYLSSLYAKESVDWQTSYTQTDPAETVGQNRISEFTIVWHHAIKMREPRIGEKLLDFGSQTGEFGKIAMTESGIIPFGIELSADYAVKCRANWKDVGHVHVGTIESSQFPQNSFQYISAQEVLEHMVDPSRSLRAFHTLMVQDGVLMISVPSSHYFFLKYCVFNLLMRVKKRFSTGNVPEASVHRVLVHTHLYNFSPRSLEIILHNAGFVVKELKGIGWHGRLKVIGSFFGGLVRILTSGRIILFPSIFCLAVKSDGNL